jgi:hypothetical protein
MPGDVRRKCRISAMRSAMMIWKTRTRNKEEI